MDQDIMGIRIPTLIATLFVGVSALLSQPALAAERSCNILNAISTHNGYGFARGLLVQEDVISGKRVGAYKATKVSDIQTCTRVCEADANCTAVTFSGLQDRKCLHFAGYDFETKRPLRFKIYNGGGTGRSAAIRAYHHGPLCNN